MHDIHVEVAGQFKTAKAVRAPGSLPVKTINGFAGFALPQLSDYELVVLQ